MKKIALSLLAALTLSTAAFAQDNPSVDAQVFVVETARSADGVVTTQLRPIEETNTKPGTPLLYEVSINNPTGQDLTEISLRNTIPAEIDLSATSLSGPEGFTAQLMSTSGETATIYPAPETLDASFLKEAQVLTLNVPLVPAGQTVSMTYGGQIKSN
jgi:hypothetical protein